MSAFDLDEAALVKKPKPIGWFAAGLIGVAALGFVGAYYLPLQAAHTTLLEKHEELAKKSNELDQALKDKNKALTSSTQRKDELERFVKGGTEAENKLKSQLQIEQATAERQLTAYIKAKLAHVEVADTELVLGFSERAVFSPHAEKMIPQSQTQICKAIQSIGQNKDFTLRVETRTPATEKDAWALSAARAAAAAELLTARCKVDAGQVVAESNLTSGDEAGDALVIHVSAKESPLLKASQAPAATL